VTFVSAYFKTVWELKKKKVSNPDKLADTQLPDSRYSQPKQYFLHR